MKPFHAILLGLFVALAIGSVSILAGFTGRGAQSVGSVAIWGPLPESIVGTQIQEIKFTRTDFSGVTYTQMNPNTFIPELIEAIAANRGPDLVVFPAAYLVKHGDKLQEMPYSVMSSPNHMRKRVAPTIVTTVVRRKKTPGSITADPAAPCKDSSPTAAP